MDYVPCHKESEVTEYFCCFSFVLYFPVPNLLPDNSCFQAILNMDTKGADLSAITRGVYILEVSLRGGLPAFYVMLWYCTTRLIITVQ